MANNHRRGRGPMGGGMHGGMNPAEKAKDFKGTMKKLFHYLGSYKIGLAAVLIFAAASTIFTIVGPKILGNATTEIFNGVMSKFSGGSGINFGAIGQILIFLICIYILSAVLSFIQGLIMSTITQKVGYKMRDEISKKIHRLPMNFFDKRRRFRHRGTGNSSGDMMASAFAVLPHMNRHVHKLLPVIEDPFHQHMIECIGKRKIR